MKRTDKKHNAPDCSRAGYWGSIKDLSRYMSSNTVDVFASRIKTGKPNKGTSDKRGYRN